MALTAITPWIASPDCFQRISQTIPPFMPVQETIATSDVLALSELLEKGWVQAYKDPYEGFPFLSFATTLGEGANALVAVYGRPSGYRFKITVAKIPSNWVELPIWKYD